ncbi:helix-turn-helix domain-containing protein [uncultured Algoriphagus sp.]|uniref:helix-turn-helix domain-containing protein n=1 Tax=uncultured Algoriphagus sp. TaxID=417365 RepID=UPI0030EF9F2D|tara:strand:+ start:1186 stop:1524 length:339 start_codon:yes stop_codon:yes gene_type:complete
MDLKFEDLPDAISQLIDQNNLILTRIQHTIPSFAENEEILTLSRICDLLELKRQTIYSYVSKRKIPYHKKAGKLYFFRQEIEEWIKAGTKDLFLDVVQFKSKKKYVDRELRN